MSRKNGVENRPPGQLNDPHGHQDVSEFASLAAMLGFKIVPAFAQYLLDARFGFLGIFDGFIIVDAQAGEFLAGVAQLPRRDLVELDGQPGLGIHDQNPVG